MQSITKFLMPSSLILGILMPVFAVANTAQPILNKINYQISMEQWASTRTAKVIVAVNATLSDQQLDSINNQILQNLKKISAQGQWHITQFHRTQTQSGLEQLVVLAQARIPESELSQLRQRAKTVSKAGETYKIASIVFSPSLAEIQKVKNDMRDKIYQAVNQELGRLNKIYPHEKFYLHTINFTQQDERPRPQMRTMAFVEGAKAQKDTDAISVSNQVVLNANVTLAATSKNK